MEAGLFLFISRKEAKEAKWESPYRPLRLRLHNQVYILKTTTHDNRFKLFFA